MNDSMTCRVAGRSSRVAAALLAAVAFESLAGSKVSWTVTREGTGPRVNEAAGILQPDGTALDDDLDGACKGNFTLDLAGEHRLVFRNGGNASSRARASVTVRTPRATARAGYVQPEGTALVPAGTALGPPRAFHGEADLAVSVTGRDFQAGADARLIREGRADIVASGAAVVSASEISCGFDLDTPDTDDTASLGIWTLGVWNAPQYAVPGVLSSLVKDSATRSSSKKFASVSSASIRLPAGVVKDAELRFIDFDGDFSDGLDGTAPLWVNQSANES